MTTPRISRALPRDEVPHLRRALPTVLPRTKSVKKGNTINPRILFVTPEISYVPEAMCPGAGSIRAKAGGMADVSASLVDQLLSQGFEQSYHHNPIDLLASAIINADYVTTVSPTFLQEIIHGTHGELPGSVQWDLRTKIEAGYARGIVNSPDPSFSPAVDPEIAQNYTATSHHEAKAFNKVVLQKELGLKVDHEAPLFLWPSRLDPIQKGCQLLTGILYQIMHDYEAEGLQLVLVGDGPFKCHFHDIVESHQLQDRVAIVDFDERISRQAFAGADFVLMPSSFEPCGLPQMIGARYGTLPIAHNTGGLRDTVESLSEDHTKGNGFLFDFFDNNGLRWAIDRAMEFHRLPAKTKHATISRIMDQAGITFNKDAMFQPYAAAYGKLAEDKLSATKHSMN